MRNIIIFGLLALLLGCQEKMDGLDIPSPRGLAYMSDSLKLSPEIYRDRILGALVGSAIGDAMGASTEMWDRAEIQLSYGYIKGLTAAVREQSPEGTWDHNLPAGASTDDTRWKYLIVQYLKNNKGQPSSKDFCKFIVDYYQRLAGDLSSSEHLKNPDLLDEKVEKIDWIKEWARVALAYNESPEKYIEAVNRFYGGEMSCAGQLYSPAFGLVAPSPLEAYTLAYEHSIFDIGYAKDISALVAAMTQVALRGSSIDSILDAAIFVDPMGYKDSRLVGRISSNIAEAARREVRLSRQSSKGTPLIAPPVGFPRDSMDWAIESRLFEYLGANKKAIPFHSGEIWEILVTALAYGQGDFEKTMQFIVNYGRDNDTVAAIAGMILGAKIGYSGLPTDLREKAVAINKTTLGLDIPAMADNLLSIGSNNSNPD